MQLKSLLIAIALLVVNQAFAAQTKQVKVGIFNNKPIVFQEQGQAPSGLAIDVLEDIALKEDWQLEYIHGSWSEVYAMLQQGKIDILVGIAYSEKRAREFHYTQQTLISNWGMVNRQAGADINSIPELQDKRIAMMEGSIHSRVFVRLLEKFGIAYEPVFVKDYHEVMRTVEAGNADAGVINRVFSLKNAKGYNLIPTSIMFNPVEVRFATSKKNSPALLQAIDRHLKRQRDDKESVYQQSLARWLTETTQVNHKLPLWLQFTAVLTIGTVLLVFAFNLFLRRQVLSRTFALKMKAVELEKKNVELVSAEKALRESEHHFKSLVETASAIPWELDLNTWRFTYVGPQAEEVFGYPLEEWYSEKFWLDHLYEEDRDEAKQYCLSQTEKHLNHEFEYRMHAADGKLIWVRDYVNVISGEAGRIRLTGFMFDITNSKQAELELHSYREQLELLVEQRTEQLHKTKDEADSANRAKSEFLSRMSHELRTPLNVIMGYSHIAESLSDDENVNKHLSEINIASKHLLDLIKDVMDLSRIETGDMKVELSKVNLKEVIKASEKFLHKEAKKESITLSLFDCEGDVFVLADSLRLKEVIMNLLSNAIKYNHKDGRVDIQCHHMDGEKVRVEVIDTGKGLDEDQMKHLFEPFSRLGAEYTDVEGTGVGLVIAKSLIERMNGTLTVSSTPKKGSCFAITLPLAQ